MTGKLTEGADMRIEKIVQAEDERYAKVQKLVNLLCHPEQRDLDEAMESALPETFPVGMKIKIDGNRITIRKKAYSSAELQKVTINTEGTLTVYNRDGRKLCGSVWLNLSTKNIEMFCVWVRKYRVPVEVVTGKGEKAIQILIVVVAMMAWFLYKALSILNR